MSFFARFKKPKPSAEYKEVCKERDALAADNKRLTEAYEAMSRDLHTLSTRLAEARAELARLKAENK